ncbi:hypothetical protein GCM10010387_50800 [Streptomyces inusitatus]|uniref:Flavin reductase like domain-containing protein n=1 Tax=Streptomyces inusitatus TaxID=68221 RepID=A0A918V0V2_9ACTN|nr:flavin reductase family protein [Streptomyces inusitatus]GGZ50453.1 hypothetical protein GCM10010387_50800 [Streptomyces inusitatus]
MTVDSAEFTRAMARVPAPVTVATTVTASGEHRGFTGSSFSALSLDPPLVLICLDKKASTHDAFTTAEHFLVNVLARGQAEVALRFAKSGVDRFADGDMVPCERGLPGLAAAAARVACSLHAVMDGGDHSILVGRVETAYVSTRTPLVYSDRAFALPVPADRLTAVR